MRGLVLFLALTTVGLAQTPETCPSLKASYHGGWRLMTTAPHDGSVVEILQTHSATPTFGLFQWSTGQWVGNAKATVTESCGFWRFYTARQGKSYNTQHGDDENNSQWCAVHRRKYDPVKDECVR